MLEGVRRAVASLFRRPPPPPPGPLSATADPRLRYRAASVPDTTGLDAQPLPFDDPHKPLQGWDFRQILELLCQVDEQPSTLTDENRCGPTAALGIAVIHGPHAVVTFAERAGAPSAAAAIRDGSATYATLHAIADAAMQSMTAAPHETSTCAEAAAMVAIVAPTTDMHETVPDKDAFMRLYGQLNPGECVLLLVDTDVLEERTAPDHTQGNHYVVAGRSLKGWQNAFVYDPYPRVGPQYVSEMRNDFWTLFETAGRSWKWMEVVSKTAAPGRR